MNKNFLPNPAESELISKILDTYRMEYVLIRVTSTMLQKSIIDASHMVRELFSKKNIVDYNELEKYDYIRKDIGIIICNNSIIETM